MAEEAKGGLARLGELTASEPRQCSPEKSLDEPFREKEDVPLRAGKFSTRHTLLIASLYLALYLPALNQSAISTALSKILSEINVDDSDAGYTWVGSAYALAHAMALPLFGPFGRTTFRLWAFLIAMAIFILGSSLCEAAVNMAMLLSARTIQGVGAGGISGLSLTMLEDVARIGGVGKYQELMAGAWAVFGALGPLLGGLLSEKANWRWVFFVNIPVGLLCTVGIWTLLPRSQATTTFRRAVQSCDLWGVAVLGMGKVLLTLGLQWATQEETWTSPAVLTALITGASALAAFIPVEMSVSSPVLPLGIFKHRTRFGGYLTAFLHSVAFSGLNYWLPLYFQGVRQQSTSQSGLSMLPWTLSFSITGVLGGVIIMATKRYREMIWIGFIIATTGCVLLKLLNSEASMAAMYTLLFFTGIGVGPNFNSPLFPVLASFDRDMADYEATRIHSAAAYAFIRSLGSSIGISISGLVFFADLANHQLPTLTVFNLTQAIEEIDYPNQAEEAAKVDVLRASMQHIFLQVCVVMGAGLLLGPLIGRHELSSGRSSPDEDEAEDNICRRVPRVDSFGTEDG